MKVQIDGGGFPLAGGLRQEADAPVLGGKLTHDVFRAVGAAAGDYHDFVDAGAAGALTLQGV